MTDCKKKCDKVVLQRAASQTMSMWNHLRVCESGRQGGVLGLRQCIVVPEYGGVVDGRQLQGMQHLGKSYEKEGKYLSGTTSRKF